MESKTIIKNSQPIKNLTKTQKKVLKFILFIPIAAILVSLPLMNSTSSSHSKAHHPSSFIKKACTETLHSSLCSSTLSTMPAPNNSTNIRKVLEFTIAQTANNVKNTRTRIVTHFTNQDLNAQENNALRDCMELLDQTMYELEEAINGLGSFRRSSYGNIKTLLSAAMTNENTCINGFLDLEELGNNLDNTQKGHREHLQNQLAPISHMISNSLALIKQVENKSRHEIVIKKPKMMVASIFDRRKKIAPKNLRSDVIVASDGSGNYSRIGEAIAMAPNMSARTYVIKIKAGIYDENVVISRGKTNIMLIGDGMNSTIITGSRNFADGFSTFDSATLTVVGDKFLAMDLTIRNNAPPQKHQAVALRVTSNAAFHHCGIISHQDTLYAHSLRQFYHNCTIQGTVDFIFGNAAAVFQNCRILVRKPIPGQRNMITAQGREDPNQNTGIILQNCTIEEAAFEFSPVERKSFPTYLGRPWRNYSRTVIVKSYLGDLIHPRGWFEWKEHSSLDTVEYIEYMNSGPGADTRYRVSWGGYRKNCSEEIVRQFKVEEFLHGANDDWLESTVFPLLGPS